MGKRINWLVALISLGVMNVALAGGNPAAGKEKSTACIACHGEGGNKPTSPDFPKLAGQHADYLFRALQDYKSGARTNPIMQGQAQNLSKQDMADLAAYFASQSSSLVTKH